MQNAEIINALGSTQMFKVATGVCLSYPSIVSSTLNVFKTLSTTNKCGLCS
jgi:hypothetical protein